MEIERVPIEHCGVNREETSNFTGYNLLAFPKS